MSERMEERIERLGLETLQVGDVVHITTGLGDEAFKYIFEVSTADGWWPAGQMTETNADGEVTAQGSIMLHGSGRWTNRTQNPVQDQERAFTMHASLSLGAFMVGAMPNNPANRIVFGKPGQAISEISVTKFQE